MNQLRTPDLFRYKQSFMVHKQKIKTIMNRSNDSIKYLSEKQIDILKKNKLSHDKAFKFKKYENQKSIEQTNQVLVTKMIQNDRSKYKTISQQINKSMSQIYRVRQNLMRSSLNSATSRVNNLFKDNDKFTKKLSSVRSALSCRDFNKQYNKHAERSSMLSKYKIDAKSFKFIPKNQIILSRISRVQANSSFCKNGSMKSSRNAINPQNQTIKIFEKKLPSTLTPIKKNSLLNFSQKPFNNTTGKKNQMIIKLSEKRIFSNTKLERIKKNPQQSSAKKVKFNNF